MSQIKNTITIKIKVSLVFQMSDLELLKSLETNMHESLTGVYSIRTNKIWTLVISMLQQLEITTHQFLSLFRNKVQRKQSLFPRPTWRKKCHNSKWLNKFLNGSKIYKLKLLLNSFKKVFVNQDRKSVGNVCSHLLFTALFA